MLNSVPMFDFSKISTLQNVSFLKIKQETEVAENNKLLPETNGSDNNLKRIVNTLRLLERQAKLPDSEDIKAKFLNHEINPENLKKGDIVNMNIDGKDYKFTIEKDGEFFCKVKGRDASVRIYMGKDEYGRDCVCFTHRYEKIESNIYFNENLKIPCEEFYE